MISHVPQNIYLSDSSIAENIAFGGLNNIDYEKLHRSAIASQSYAFIDKLPLKFNTIVGERGVSLSGGQRQRLGIARAFYKDCPILVLDEATSALDSETEKHVMNSIHSNSLNKIVIVVAHRTSTLTECDQIFKIQNGQLVLVDFDSIIN